MIPSRWMSSKITAGVVVLSVLAGCAPSQEDELAAANFHNVGTLDESSVWLSGEPNRDGDYEIAVTGKFHDYCNGAVLAPVGIQICNGGELDGGALFMIGAPASATGGTLTMMNGVVIELSIFDLPQNDDLKIAAGSAPARSAAGFYSVRFTTSSGEILNREGKSQ